MAKVSFIDDNFRLAESFIKRDYTELANEIEAGKDELLYYRKENELIVGYQIAPNVPLSELFQECYYVVRFVFANIDTMHNVVQEQCLKEMFEVLKSHMEKQKGYYNLRIPSHVVDAIKAYNSVLKEGYFCGGTVEELITDKIVETKLKEGIQIFFGNCEYIDKYRKELMLMTFESFQSYQGQYHISPVTEGKAGKIYENWIKGSLDNCNGQDIVIAEYMGAPIGFVTISEKENAVEGVLSSVDGKYRKYGAYRAMISFIVNYAADKNKSFITSTQFDNFIVQGVWNSIGLKPFYSIYNFHIDKR